MNAGILAIDEEGIYTIEMVKITAEWLATKDYRIMELGSQVFFNNASILVPVADITAVTDYEVRYAQQIFDQTVKKTLEAEREYKNSIKATGHHITQPLV